MKKYYPVLISRYGEVEALERLEQPVKDKISPVIEVTPEHFSDGWAVKKEEKRLAKLEAIRKKLERGIEVKKPKEGKQRKEAEYKNGLEESLVRHWNFKGNQILLDFKHCSNIDPRNVWTFLENLEHSKINAVPVVSNNSNDTLRDLVSRFVIDYDKKICLRLSKGESGFIEKAQIEEAVRQLNVPKKDIFLLLDVGYLEETTSQFAQSALIDVLGNIGDLNDWFEVVVCGGSFPEFLTDFEARKEPHFVKRNEWRIWKSLKKLAVLNGSKIKYGDYGIKHPIYNDVGRSGSASIKYTTENDFVIYRGKRSGDVEIGNIQYIHHAKELVSNTDVYPGEKFCWGDGKIMAYSKVNPIPIDKKPKNKPKPGGAKEWVSFGANHHLTLLESIL
jgi:hypothetical protein